MRFLMSRGAGPRYSEVSWHVAWSISSQRKKDFMEHVSREHNRLDGLATKASGNIRQIVTRSNAYFGQSNECV